MVAVFSAQGHVDVEAWSVAPRALAGLRGLLAAPLLHGSPGHLMSNVFALLLLGSLAGSVYPRATVRAVPIAWLASGVSRPA